MSDINSTHNFYSLVFCFLVDNQEIKLYTENHIETIIKM
jgi:hypothetical protein